MNGELDHGAYDPTAGELTDLAPPIDLAPLAPVALAPAALAPVALAPVALAPVAAAATVAARGPAAEEVTPAPAAEPTWTPPPPRPKAVILAQLTETGWRTASVELQRCPGGLLLTAHHAAGQTITVRLGPSHVAQLLRDLEIPERPLWSTVASIPIARPLPSRALDDELRVLFATYAAELRDHTAPRRER